MNNRQLIKEAFDFDDVTICLRHDGVLLVYVKDEAVINRKMQENIIFSIIRLKGGDPNKYPAIIELGEFISMAEDLVLHTDLPYKEHILSVAVYAKNTADRIIAKYYTRKYKTSSQFIIFNSFEEALDYSYERMKSAGIDFLPCSEEL